MKIVLLLLVAVTCWAVPVNARAKEVGVVEAATEIQDRLLSLERSASGTDRNKVSVALNDFAGAYGFTTSEEPRSPLWNIQRVYVGPHYTSLIVSFFPDHTFIGLFKRPGDGSTHQDMVDAINSRFGPLGFKPAVDAGD